MPLALSRKIRKRRIGNRIDDNCSRRTRTPSDGARFNKKAKDLGRERKDHYVNELFKFMKKMAAATLCASVYYFQP
jgi:hypothetical protein